MQATRSIEEIFDRVAATTLDLNGWQGHAISISDLRTLRNALLLNRTADSTTSDSSTAASDAFTPTSSFLSLNLSDAATESESSREALTEGFLAAISNLDKQIDASQRLQALAEPRDRPAINHRTGALQRRRAELARRLNHV